MKVRCLSKASLMKLFYFWVRHALNRVFTIYNYIIFAIDTAWVHENKKVVCHPQHIILNVDTLVLFLLRLHAILAVVCHFFIYCTLITLHKDCS